VRLERLADQDVIDSPADIPFPGPGHEIPPGVGPGRVRMQVAVRIDEAVVDSSVALTLASMILWMATFESEPELCHEPVA
jgi:hypothetical protein